MEAKQTFIPTFSSQRKPLTQVLFLVTLNNLGKELLSSPPKVETFYSGNVFIPLLCLKNVLSSSVPSVMFKKEVLDTVGYIDESLIIGSDVDFFLRMAYQRFNGIFSNEIFVTTRKHDQNTSQRLEVASHPRAQADGCKVF